MSRVLNEKSVAYWINRESTYLAAPEYYDRQEIELRAVLANIGSVARVGDVGCGDGRYTLVALETAQEAVGLDINANLIAQASRRANSTAGFCNINFLVGSFDDLEIHGPFDLVLCLGVISALIDQVQYQSALDQIARAVTPSGWLVTKDTLADDDAYIAEQGEYVAHYRNRESYIRTITDRGFELKNRVELIKATPNTTNAIYVFRCSR